MIVDLRLNSRSVLVVGGGGEATKRVSMMASEGCSITVASPAFSEAILEMAERGQVALRQEAVRDDAILDEVRPDVVVAATDDHRLNRVLASSARERGMIAYSSSDPGISDYAHLATMEFGGTVRVAVSTGGRSPIMARVIRDRAREALSGIVTDEVLDQIRVQEEARTGAKNIGSGGGDGLDKERRKDDLYGLLDASMRGTGR